MLHHKKSPDRSRIPVDIPSRWEPPGPYGLHLLIFPQPLGRALKNQNAAPTTPPVSAAGCGRRCCTGLIACGAACRRPVRAPSIAQTKKKNQYTLCTGFSWCSKAIQIRTISLGCNFCRFSKGHGLCAFFIIEGYQNLIIIQVNRIDEGIHQRLPLVFQAHIQLTEPQQPEPNEFFGHFRFASFSSAMRASSSRLVSSSCSSRSLVELVRIPA